MRRRASPALFAAFALALTFAFTSRARADHRPTIATDGFFVGTRAEPGWALVGAWDLDVYVQRDRSISLGPAVSIAVLSSTVSDGRMQDLLLAVDFVRIKAGPAVTGGAWRPFVTLGGGFTYARLPAQMATGVEVVPDGGGMPVRGTVQYAALEEFAPLVTVGAGTDYFINGPLGATVQLLGRFHPTGSSRVPDAWIELQLGFRFGL